MGIEHVLREKRKSTRAEREWGGKADTGSSFAAIRITDKKRKRDFLVNEKNGQKVVG